jgi:calcineurin-like phosphoesterase family protein
MIYFTSDTHFGHTNIIKYCNRPFADLHEMNRALVHNWNERVGPQDTVYHLGDFHMGPKVEVAAFRKKLNGRIHLIRGNHDRSAGFMRECGFEVHESYQLAIGPDFTPLFLRHKPPRMLETLPIHTYFLCGHVHTEWARQGNVINVGVDVRGFRPVTLEELLS